MSRLCAFSAALSLLGCAHAAPNKPTPPATTNAAPTQTGACPALPAAAEASSAQVIERFGSRIEPYQLEGGVWLPNAPVLVNEDFDFSTAMALGPVGAGLAAQKRKEANQRKAELLAKVELGPGSKAALASLRQRGVHAFFVLWGAGQAVLRLVVERDVTCEARVVPEARESAPALVQGGWDQPQALDLAAQLLLADMTKSS